MTPLNLTLLLALGQAQELGRTHGWMRPQSREWQPAGSRPQSREIHGGSSAGSSRATSRPASRETTSGVSSNTGSRPSTREKRGGTGLRQRGGIAPIPQATDTHVQRPEQRQDVQELAKLMQQSEEKINRLSATARDSFAQMHAVLDEQESTRGPLLERLRAGLPPALEPFEPCYLQIQDMREVRKALEQAAEDNGDEAIEDEYEHISHCKFKYNPINEQEHYLPNVGKRAFLTNRGVPVEILGDPADDAEQCRWRQRVQMLSKAATCGPMERARKADRETQEIVPMVFQEDTAVQRSARAHEKLMRASRVRAGQRAFAYTNNVIKDDMDACSKISSDGAVTGAVLNRVPA